MSELKPCPFCGGTKFWVYNERWTAFFPKYVVQCCFCYKKSKPRISERRARKDWNRRADKE